MVLAIAAPAEARTVIRTGETVSVGEDQRIEGDFYTVAGRTNLSGVITEDLLVAAGQLRTNGSVGQDALLVGGAVDVHGTIGDDLRILGGEVVIAEAVAGDVVVVGGRVDVLSTATIGGDLVVYGGDVTVAGSVAGDILGAAERLRIDNAVGGGVDVHVSLLTIGANASITNAVQYTSREIVARAPDAIIGGELVRNDPPAVAGRSVAVEPILMPTLIIVFSTLVWFLLSRSSLERVTKHSLRPTPRAGLIGFASFFLLPLASLLLLVSVIGGLLGFLILFGYVMLIIFALIAMPAVIGQLLLRLFNQAPGAFSLLAILVGVITIGLLLLLPFIGEILLAAAFLVAFGTLVELLLKPLMQRQ
ncbi:MAG: hypothetical protein ACOC4E_00495 [Patescibacteria group bacterium]